MTSVDLSLTTHVDTPWGPTSVTLGLLDEDARYAFTQGQCHALAMAVHEDTGWPIVAWSFWRYGDVPDHYLVKTPDGQLLDIKGTHDQGDLNGRTWETDVETMRSFVVPGCYVEPNLPVAKTFVGEVLALWDGQANA